MPCTWEKYCTIDEAADLGIAIEEEGYICTHPDVDEFFIDNTPRDNPICTAEDHDECYCPQQDNITKQELQ